MTDRQTMTVRGTDIQTKINNIINCCARQTQTGKRRIYYLIHYMNFYLIEEEKKFATNTVQQNIK